MKTIMRRGWADWTSRQLQGAIPAPPETDEERRNRPDRRRRVLWSILYGSFNPRRRRPPRRSGDSRFHAMDWHGAHLLAVSIGILILNVADALLTVELLSRGAVEVNPIMAALIDGSPAIFATMKMAMTGLSVLLLVILGCYRFMRVLRVELILYGVLIAYLVLIGHEINMLQRLVGSAIL
ncbi:MAG TPA: DUF5658 family protein [Steroidobacteraceae bacterium]|nr:DUF5658 family protein [Steroidobacteraceae bacterium]